MLSTYLFIVPKFKWAILSGFYQRNLVNRPCLICENNTFLFLRNCSPQVQPCTSYGGIEIAALSLHTHIHHTHNTPLKCMRWWTHGPSTRNLWLQYPVRRGTCDSRWLNRDPFPNSFLAGAHEKVLTFLI